MTDTQKSRFLMRINPLARSGRRAVMEQAAPPANASATASAGARRKLLATSVDWRALGKVSAVRDQGG